MRLAGKGSGFTYGKHHGKEQLRVDLMDVTDPDVQDALTESETADRDDETDIEDPATETESYPRCEHLLVTPVQE
ncbi:hypothetical protein BRC71_11040 [Halobacteriales archaeon QH_7_65_31]|nr:MAG: hypothetical protein BRC71_11040 [Halobacteriales archaeon QH_7_65_31]